MSKKNKYYRSCQSILPAYFISLRLCSLLAVGWKKYINWLLNMYSSPAPRAKFPLSGALRLRSFPSLRSSLACMRPYWGGQLVALRHIIADDSVSRFDWAIDLVGLSTFALRAISHPAGSKTLARKANCALRPSSSSIVRCICLRSSSFKGVQPTATKSALLNPLKKFIQFEAELIPIFRAFDTL